MRQELPAVVSFDNLVAVRHEGEVYIDGADEPIFDLNRLHGASSAVVALMVAWFRYAHGRGKVASFVNVPEGIMNIIEVTDLNDVLAIEASAEATVGEQT